MKKISVILSVPILLFLVKCKVDPQIIPELPSDNLVEVIPPGWPQPHYTYTNNPLTEDRFILGRALFYEPMLSKNNDISCAFCHKQEEAFSNKSHRVSHNLQGADGNRNAPGMFNLAWHPYYMHDGGVLNLELQPIAPISNPVEMDEDINNIVSKLQASRKYRTLFTSAYGSDSVTSQRILKALAQFTGLMYSYNSKFDQYKRGENNVQLTEEELRGYQLFKANCNACHTEPLFTDFKFRSNGLKASNDSGRAHIEALPQNRYKFKTPSLRNVEVTWPYMHDGTYDSLEVCLDHYTMPKKNLVNLDPLLQNPMQLSARDKKDIIAFLKTLTDHKFLGDMRFADPNIPKHP
ncbi:MAG: c-type cytochrome [Bacteroidia bacterium]|nr:c-type cytochrome [Bacteroidia bacterium]